MEITTKLIPTKYVKLEDIEVKCDDFLEIMEDLEDTNIYDRLVIYNKEFAQYLEQTGLAERNAKGSYQRTELFDIVWPKLRDEYFDKMHEK